jgi:hypothetical protein
MPAKIGVRLKLVESVNFKTACARHRLAKKIPPKGGIYPITKKKETRYWPGRFLRKRALHLPAGQFVIE